MKTFRRRSLALLAGFALVAAACGGSDDPKADEDSDTTEATDDDTETTDDTDDTETTEPADSDLSSFAQDFAEGFSESAGFSLPDDEIECITEAMIDELSFDELTAISESATAPDGEIVETIATIFDDCTSSERVKDALGAQIPTGVDDEVAPCILDAAAEEFTLGDFLRIGVGTDDELVTAFQTRFQEIGAECGAT